MKVLLIAAGCVLFCAMNAAAYQTDQVAGQTVLRAGSRPSAQANPENFVGNVRVDPAFRSSTPARSYGAWVTFEPGARTNWHTHPMGQTLIVTSGRGITQEWGKQPEIILPGDVVNCPPGVTHWHGAMPDTAMTHLAISESNPDRKVKWLEKVDQKAYEAAASFNAAGKETGK